jgi:hypothetical protein
MLSSPQTLQMAASMAEIIAAVAVMISVIYLAIQVRHSNKQARLQTHSDTLLHMHAPIQQFLAQPELAEIIRVGGTSPDDLTEADWFKFGYYYLMQFNMYEFLYAAHLDKATAPQIWIGCDASWKNVFRQEPGVRKAWREWRHAYIDPFQGYVDAIVRDAEKAQE